MRGVGPAEIVDADDDGDDGILRGYEAGIMGPVDMSPEAITTAVAAVVIIGFLWSLHRNVAGLHRDMSDLRECMARLEGQVQMLASQMQTVMQNVMVRDRERERTT